MLVWEFADVVCLLFWCFFKQKTAYELRISDWSSDVCSSDLNRQWPPRRIVDRDVPARAMRCHPPRQRAIGGHQGGGLARFLQRRAQCQRDRLRLLGGRREFGGGDGGEPPVGGRQPGPFAGEIGGGERDRKSTRLNSSH